MVIREDFADKERKEKEEKNNAAKEKRESLFSFLFADEEDKNDDKNEAVDRKVNVDNSAKIEVSPTPSITVDAASIPKPKE